MKNRVLTAAGLLLLLTVFYGCVLTVRSSEERPAFGTMAANRGPRIALDRLSGADERISGSDRVVTEDFDIRGFSRVEVSHAFRVEVVQGSSYRVAVRVDENLQQHLRVEKRGDTLVIGLKPLKGYNLGNVTTEAEVRMPEILGIQASGASNVRIDGFSSDEDFDVALSGASYLEGEITAQDVSIEASGASRIRLRGRAEDLRLNASGASNLDLGNFPAGDGDIELSSASEAQVVLSGILDVDASGASRLYLGGSPTMGRIDLSGASSIKRR